MLNHLILPVLFLSCLVSIDCATVPLAQYTVTIPSQFRGINPNFKSCFRTAVYTCTTGGVLSDGSTVPSTVDLNASEYVRLFFPWSRTLQPPPYAVFSFNNVEVTIATIGLSFLNYPNERIGLPNFRVFQALTSVDATGGTEIFYTLRDNGLLSTADQKLATVYLDLFPVTGVMLENVRIEMSFSDLHNIDWFLLSEVTFDSTRAKTVLPSISFEQPDSSLPVNRGNSLQLSCTVTVDGLFEWRWMMGKDRTLTGDIGSPYQVETALATRASFLTKVDIACPTDVGNYTCEATFVVNTGFRDSRTTVVTVTSGAQVEVDSHVTGDLGTSVDLTCHVTNYGGFGDITWAREGNLDTPLVDSPPKYTITRSSLTHDSGASGCSDQSLNVTLTIGDLVSGDVGRYVCSVAGDVQDTATLTIPGVILTTTTVDPTTSSVPNSVTPTSSAGTTIPPTPVPETGGSSGGGSGNIGAIVGGVIVGVVFLAVLVAIIIVVVVLIKRHSTTAKVEHREQRQGGTQNGDATRRSRKYTAEDIEWQVYSSVNKESAPPVPPQNFDPSDVGVVTTHKLHQIDQARLEEPPPIVPPRRNTGFSGGKPKLAKLTVGLSKYKMKDNPMYQSASEVDYMKEDETSFTDDLEFHIYADPAVERSYATVPTATSSSTGGQEPIYSEALEPSMFSEEPAVNEDDLRPYGPIYADPQPLLRSEAPIELMHEHIREIKQLGIGEFGAVVLAETIGVSMKDLNLSTTDDDRNVVIQVAVKKLKPHAQVSLRMTFEREVKFMSRLKDDNIVRLLAICTSDSPFIVMEYMENGDLNQYLQKHELADADSVILPSQLPVSLLVYMAVQVASGMRYLASLRFVHRDMATRNCLVGQHYTVKIADFGMSKSLYEHAYYRVRGRAKLPIRWMATECFYGRFSEKTDVWAFGVTMWEIFMLGKEQPYEEIDDQEVIQDAVRGASRQLLGRPEPCPPEVYDVMLRCWEYQTENRADFEELFSSLAAIHQRM